MHSYLGGRGLWGHPETERGPGAAHLGTRRSRRHEGQLAEVLGQRRRVLNAESPLHLLTEMEKRWFQLSGSSNQKNSFSKQTTGFESTWGAVARPELRQPQGGGRSGKPTGRRPGGQESSENTVLSSAGRVSLGPYGVGSQRPSQVHAGRGLSCVPRNSYVGVLTPRTPECDFLQDRLFTGESSEGQVIRVWVLIKLNQQEK